MHGSSINGLIFYDFFDTSPSPPIFWSLLNSFLNSRNLDNFGDSKIVEAFLNNLSLTHEHTALRTHPVSQHELSTTRNTIKSGDVDKVDKQFLTGFLGQNWKLPFMLKENDLSFKFNTYDCTFCRP